MKVVPTELILALAAEAPKPKPIGVTPSSPIGRKTTVTVRPDRRVERYRAYMSKVPEAVSGEGGHRQMFKAARVIFAGFAIEGDCGLQLLAEYNQRCQPPFGERDLRHKWDEAVKAGPDAHKGTGYLLNDEQEPAQRRTRRRPPRLSPAASSAEILGAATGRMPTRLSFAARHMMVQGMATPVASRGLRRNGTGNNRRPNDQTCPTSSSRSGSTAMSRLRR